MNALDCTGSDGDAAPSPRSCVYTRRGRRVPNFMKAGLIGVLFTAAALAADAPAPLMDFSSAGFGGGGVALPTVAAKFSLAPSGRDDTRAIQAALDAVGAL